MVFHKKKLSKNFVNFKNFYNCFVICFLFFYKIWIKVLEMISGVDLFELSNKLGPMSESIVRHIVSQVVDIVAKLAENRIAHRDIKDENIMVDINTYKGISPYLTCK